VKRDFLLQTLENELPKGTIRYSSKIVAIEEDGNVTVLHLADGSIIRTKVRYQCAAIPISLSFFFFFFFSFFSSRC
jgi:hypothetical protein